MFLNAAAALIDAALDDDASEESRRIRAIKFPVALEWIRLQDVLTLAQRTSRGAASKKAFSNRWPSKDEFIRDAVVHTMLYRDTPDQDPVSLAPDLGDLPSAPTFSAGVASVVDALVAQILSHPRSFLLAHLAPLLPRHPDLAEEITASARRARDSWTSQYPVLLKEFGFEFRPEWTHDRITLSLSFLLDGFTVRSRIEPATIKSFGWPGASLFADTVLAFLVGVIDIDRSDRTARQWLDAHVGNAPPGPE